MSKRFNITLRIKKEADSGCKPVFSMMRKGRLKFIHDLIEELDDWVLRLGDVVQIELRIYDLEIEANIHSIY